MTGVGIPRGGRARRTGDGGLSSWSADGRAPDTLRIAGGLMRATAQRASEPLGMRKTAFKNDWVTVVDEKGGENCPLDCPPRPPQYIDGLAVGPRYVLARSNTAPLSFSAVETAFSANLLPGCSDGALKLTECAPCLGAKQVSH